jgi:hypothetical protein
MTDWISRWEWEGRSGQIIANRERSGYAMKTYL